MIDVNFEDVAKDTITGFKGKVVNISLFMVGGYRVGIQPEVNRQGDIPDMKLFDLE